MALCYCGNSICGDAKYCDECLDKKEQFVETVVNDYNCSDIGAFEYIVTNASEKVRVKDMSESIGSLVDDYYMSSDELSDPYTDNSFLERVYTLKVELLERFLDLLATRHKDMGLMDSLEFYYKTYEDRIRSDIELTNNYLNSLRESIVNPSKRVLTKES